MTSVQRQIEVWGAGIDSEIGFWSRVFETRGLSWPDDYQARLNPNTPIYPSYIEPISHLDIAAARILDVGSGPISKLGKVHQGIRLNITACDPLAEHYAKILEMHGITPAIRTVKAFAEDLACYFDRGSFDLVTCTNALDHSLEPLRGIVQMLEVVKVGGTVLLEHAFREAENENYNGLHQWNFDIQDGRFVIWNCDNRIDVADHLVRFADIATEDRGYMTATIKKTAPVPVSEFTDERGRVRALLDAAVAISHLNARELGSATATEAKAARAEARAKAAECRAAAAEIRAESAETSYRAILTSTSWRISAPLRALARRLSSRRIDGFGR